MEKIFIIGATVLNKYEIAESLIEADSSLNIANKFTTNNDVNIQVPYLFYKTEEQVCMDYKNNSLLFVNSITDFETTGIDIDEYYNKDIFCMNYKEFNNISNNIIKNSDILIIWVDSLLKYAKCDINECDSFINALNKYEIPYLYFIDDSLKYITDTIIKYINGTDKEKLELRDINS